MVGSPARLYGPRDAEMVCITVTTQRSVQDSLVREPVLGVLCDCKHCLLWLDLRCKYDFISVKW